MHTHPFLKQLRPGLLFFFAAFTSLQCAAQSAFKTETALCDTAAWRLVFSDEFEGTTLDRSKWHSFNAWAGMTPEEHENWGGSRLSGNHSILKDENVVVQGGVCALILKKEETTWKCDTCATSHRRPYSTGAIVTHYTRPFRYAKYEARIRFPDFKWAHCTFWTWPGESPSADRDLPELDIAEAYGYKGVPVAGNNGFRHIEWAAHRWKPHNAYSVKQSLRFPRQTFAAWMQGRYFDFTQWHTYAAESDSNRIAFYLDGELVGEAWRYRCEDGRGGYTPSGCNPGGRRCEEDPAWPTSDFSRGSNIHLNMDIDADKIDRAGEAGRMEIDWVRVWERSET